MTNDQKWWAGEARSQMLLPESGPPLVIDPAGAGDLVIAQIIRERHHE
jgi:hypothetical protein